MQVRIIVPLASEGYMQFVRGEIAQLPDALAEHWIARRYAIPISPTPEPETATLRPAPETTSLKRARR